MGRTGEMGFPEKHHHPKRSQSARHGVIFRQPWHVLASKRGEGPSELDVLHRAS